MSRQRRREGVGYLLPFESLPVDSRKVLGGQKSGNRRLLSSGHPEGRGINEQDGLQRQLRGQEHIEILSKTETVEAHPPSVFGMVNLGRICRFMQNLWPL